MTTPAGPAAPQEPAAPAAPAAPAVSDKGFPEGTPLTEMTDTQKAAYWQHYARKHEDTVKAFNGLTPQQVKDALAENESLKTEKLSADDKALKAARDEASKAAADAAKAEYLPQIQQLQVKSIASQVIQGDKLNAFMAIVNPAALVGDDGTVDETKVMGHLTAMYGETPAAPTTGQRWQNAGQFTQAPPGAKPGSAGEAEAAKRFGSKSKS